MRLSDQPTILVTGGAGFIGSAVVRLLIQRGGARVVNVDRLTYAASLDSVRDAARSPDYVFERVDVADADAVRELFRTYRPSAVMHLAAESHVDRSIDGPGQFVHTNVQGTFTMLQEALTYWADLAAPARERFRFLQVSTDEVYGSLGAEGLFTPDSAYRPRSPYSATKAAADHLARAWQHTYGLPVLVTNCSNNYGPFQFPEKLIPHTILRAFAGKPLPVYGRGENVRDWLHVEDHAEALVLVLERGTVGETYLIGGRSERRNIDVVRKICAMVDELAPDPRIGSRETLIEFVSDRPGHDFRYAIDNTRIRAELGWSPRFDFESGLRDTVAWYRDNEWWWSAILERGYRAERIGLGARA